jgi:glycosyltransferase involved in cell wall biosynthesis
MRILMLASSYPKYPGETTAPFIEEIAAGIAARGHAVHLVAPWHPDIRRERCERGVQLHFYRYAPLPGLNIWGYAQSLISDTMVKGRTLAVLPFALTSAIATLSWVAQHEAAAGRPFDLIQAHWVLPNAPPAALVAAALGLPLVISLHGSDIYLAERHWALVGATGLVFRRAAAITACSSDLHGRGVRLGAPVERSRVVPYGVDPGEFRPDAQARAQVRAELGLSDDEQIVFGMGRLVAKKGFGVLIEAWPQVLEQHPRALLVIAGNGDLREPLEQQARGLGIQHRVRFVGTLERSRAAAYIAAADVFALPIVREGVDGLPNVLLEAMGAGRAVVASRVAGVPDVIDDGIHGLIVPERQPAPLAAAINRLLTDQALATRLGSAARERIANELTWAQTAARYEQAFELALAIDDQRPTTDDRRYK